MYLWCSAFLSLSSLRKETERFQQFKKTEKKFRFQENWRKNVLLPFEFTLNKDFHKIKVQIQQEWAPA